MRDLPYEFSTDWFSGVRVNFEYLFRTSAVLARSQTLVEVGSFEGRSAAWMLDHVIPKGGTLHCIDLEGRTRLFNNLRRHQNVEIHCGTLLDHLGLFSAGSVDFFYIDGSHLAWDVLTDIVPAFSRLKVGGVMLMDDFGWSDPAFISRHYRVPDAADPRFSPRLAIESFLKIFKDQYEFVRLPNPYQCAIRKLKNPYSFHSSAAPLPPKRTE